MSYKLFFILIFSTHFIYSQDLFIGNDTYLYAKDHVIFVNNDIKLDTPTSNIFLRGDAQLVQNADIKNSDEGELSIYQNQTTGVYEYNFFCSPVGVSDSSLNTNLDFDRSVIHDPENDTDLSNIVSAAYKYTTANEGTATQLSSRWLYTLRNSEGSNDWTRIYETTTIESGYGFITKGSPNTNNVLDFRGRPNNGTITVSCSFDGVDDQPNSGKPDYAETLTGNPYPSALDLKLFLMNSNNQADLSGEIFFWEQKEKNSHFLVDYEGGYSMYVPGAPNDLDDNGSYTTVPFENYNGDGSSNGESGNGNTTDYSLNNERRFAAVGQGFIIASNVDGGNAIFDNSMRVYFPEDSAFDGDGSVFAKNENSKSKENEEKRIPISHNSVNYKSLVENPTVVPEIRIHTHINNTFYKENVIAFRESTPDNKTYNRFYDGRNINELSSDAYLISGGNPLVIKSINYDEATRIPLGLKASEDNSSFSIKINKLKDVPEAVNIYVFDNEKNTYTDIKKSTFEINLEAGIYNNRFEITFNKNNSLSIDEAIFDDLKVFQDNTRSQLKIYNPKVVNIKMFSLIDLSGKHVLIDNKIATKKQLIYSTKLFSDGIYIAKLTTNTNQVLSKKVRISNSK